MSGNSHLVNFLVGPEVDPAEANQYIDSLKHAPLESIEMILRTLMQNIEMFTTQGKLIDELFRLLQSNMLRQSRDEAQRLDPDLVMALYDNLPEQQSSRFILLHCLAIARTPDHLHLLCEALVLDPPQTWVQSGLILSPLFQHDDWDVDLVFPRVLDAVEHTAVAGVVLDLANHQIRSQRLDQHPGQTRSDQLISLLGALVARLERTENDPASMADTPDEMHKIVGEAVALIVSLCDSLALIADDRAVPVLHSAMALTHRRIQTEAAGALARFGNPEGTERLLSLAAEPSARLRVLAYAEELSIDDQIDETYKTPASRAEAELALWLAQPGQMSVPPSRIEVLDNRCQFWPGFDEPIECFLLRFDYTLADRAYSNLGLTGPMVHAFEADLTSLPIDDAYAAFAGWQAEHEDIYEVDPGHWNESQRRIASEFSQGLKTTGYEAISPEFLGFFLGECAIVAAASKDETSGVCVTDGLETLWFPATGQRALSQGDVWNIYKGRKILRTFNS